MTRARAQTWLVLAMFLAGRAHAEKPPLAVSIGPLWVTPIVAPAYTPELGALLFGGIVASWKADQESPRSTLAVTGGVGTTGAVTFNVRGVTYSFTDRLRADLDVWFKNMPDHYFGVGYRAAQDTPGGRETTFYHRLWFQLAPTLLVRVTPSTYAGLAMDWNGTDATSLSPGVLADRFVSRQGTHFQNLGLGGALRYDTRDFPQAAFRGTFAQLKVLAYASLANAPTYQIVDVDVRHYLPLSYIGQTLAFGARLRHGVGDVPWPELSQLGSPFDFRGYRWGQYRDRTMLYGLVEFRHTFLRGPREARSLGRHGVVTWLGLGILGDGFDGIEGALPNMGVGYRLFVQDRLAIRFDLGVGVRSINAYVNFGEAF